MTLRPAGLPNIRKAPSESKMYGTYMGYRSLAEAVILQSMEDLSDPRHREESREFFMGEGFKIYGDIAELTSINKIKIIHLARGRRHDRATGVLRA
jgi:hypothetical protein